MLNAKKHKRLKKEIKRLKEDVGYNIEYEAEMNQANRGLRYEVNTWRKGALVVAGLAVLRWVFDGNR